MQTSSPASRALSAMTSPSRATPESGSAAGEQSRVGRWARHALTVGLVATVFLTQAIPAVSLLRDGQDVPLSLAFRAINFLLAPILLSVSDRFLARRGRTFLSRTMLGGAIAVLAGGAIGPLLWSGVIPHVVRDGHGVIPDVTGGSALAQTLLGSFAIGAARTILVVGVWSLAVVFPQALAQEKITALQVANLELEAARLRGESELTRLRGQLEPHFLLNTLNLISGLVGMDVEKARRTIVNLGDLLRDALEPHGECQSVADEIQWLERYSEILAARHGPTLTFEWDVDRRARAACLPRLLLQPLVENAILHGALRAEGKGIVAVRVRIATAERVEISIEDNGPGPTDATRAGAVGIANVRRRLELTHPDATFTLTHDDTGTRARLSLPYALHVQGEAKA